MGNKPTIGNLDRGLEGAEDVKGGSGSDDAGNEARVRTSARKALRRGGGVPVAVAETVDPISTGGNAARPRTRP